MDLLYQNMVEKEKAVGIYMENFLFILSGVEKTQITKMPMILADKHNMPLPITLQKQYKSLTRLNKSQAPSYMPGTTDADSLQAQLLKELEKTSQLMKLSQQIQNQNKKRKSHQLHTILQPKRPGDPGMSPGTLQRKYLPNTTRRRANHQPHPRATAAAAAAQAQPPLPHRGPEKTQTKLRLKTGILH